MKDFLDEHFLLNTKTAQTLYHEYAKKMPIIDYHCHVDPADIANNKQYDSITDVWLGGDHYKWRVMRADGVPEENITGKLKTAPDVVFRSWAKTLPKLIGNPLFDWTYLELQRYFDEKELLNEDTADKIYDRCNKILQSGKMNVRDIIKKSNVKLICTTDDPIDSLEYHQQIKDDPTCEVQVLPAFRPDKAMNINHAGFSDYMKKLATVSGQSIASFSDLKKALSNRIEFFASMGCKASDHALDYCIFETATDAELDGILADALKNDFITDAQQVKQFQTAILLHLAKEYAQRGWVMQIHFGCIRDNSTKMFTELGANTGYDAMGDSRGAEKLSAMLNAMELTGDLPKMILYSLNPNDNEVIMTVGGCFQTNSEVPGKIQLGSAWWFNDTKSGMEKQLQDFANTGVLANFVGMLTDSRSFLSYTRHEYFRRLLCNFIGNLVENGEYPHDMKTLGKIVQDISYNNTVRLFGFSIEG